MEALRSGVEVDAHERVLLARVCDRDAGSFEQLYRDYYPRLYRFALRMLGRSDAVDEVVNETMFVVWQRAATYNGNCKVSTWIFGIAYNKARGRAGEPGAIEDSLEDEQADADASEDDGHWLGRLETREMLESALRVLSAEQRAVVELGYFFGLGYREIAAIVHCPENTVKTRMYHARRRLARCLRDHHPGR